METYEKLDPEFKAKWVSALRSGEIKQGKAVMYNSYDDSLCCLAVAGILCGMSKDDMIRVDIFNLEEDAHLEEKIATAKAISFGYPNLLIRKGRTSVAVKLAEMNDSGRPFSEIADWIEANL